MQRTRTVSEYVARAATATHPEEQVELAALHLLDTLAAIVACRDLEPAVVARRYVTTWAGAGERRGVTILGTSQRAPLVDAVFAGAMTAHAAEINDFIPSVFVQPGPAVVATALGVGQAVDASGSEVIGALIAGYELAERVPRAVGVGNLRRAGIANHGVGPCFGAAAAASALLRQSPDRVADVLSVTAQQAAGSWQWLLDVEHMEKAFVFAGLGARNGLQAALLVESGFRGIPDVADRPGTWFTSAPFSADDGDGDLDALVEGLGDTSVFSRVAYKRFPVGGPTQPAVEALLDLAPDVSAARVRRVGIDMPGRAQAFRDAEMPALNLRYLAAIILLDQRLDFVAAQSRSRMLGDATVRALMDRVDVRHDPAQEAGAGAERTESARVTLELDDGRILERFVPHVLGFPSHPMTRDDVEAKALDLVTGPLGAERARRLVETSRDPKAHGASELVELISVAGAEDGDSAHLVVSRRSTRSRLEAETMALRSLDTDYLVVGAGAMGMAFADALIDHADVHVTLVDRRHAAGGHWHDAYPFVQLHQASVFYGVASTVLGGGAVQPDGPEAGLQERGRRSEIQHYYDEILHRRFIASGQVRFLGGTDYHSDGTDHLATSTVSGETVRIDVRRRVVDATYLSPTIPATTPPPFEVADPGRVVAINQLASLAGAPTDFVIVGSGKTATDGIVWLLRNGVPPDRIIWVRPRDPWMLNRAVVQPDPVVATRLAADTMAAAAGATNLDELFLGLEAAGVMLRIAADVTPTMAKTPTLGLWELELLRTVERVVRLGHLRRVTSDELVFDAGTVRLPPGSLVVHCAASGLQYPPLVPLWAPDRIRLQTIRVGFPCFNAALAGYVEATRDDDRERNRLCPPNTLPDTPGDWARMQVRGALASRAFGAEPDIAEWANGCALNPARVTPAQRDDPEVQAAAARLASAAPPGLARMAELAGEPLPAPAGG